MQKSESEKTSKRIVFFFPYDPFPPRSGAQIRCLEMLSGILSLNCEVIFLSVRNYSEKSWEKSSYEFLRKKGVKDIYIYQITFFEMIMSAVIRRIYLVLDQLVPVDSIKYTPRAMRSWFKKIQLEYHPEIIWMNYSVYYPLIYRREGKIPLCVLDCLDLVTLNQKMQEALKPYFSHTRDKLTDESVLREDFLSKVQFSPDNKELQIITHFDKVIAISPDEAEFLQAFDRNADITYIPVTCTPVDCNNSYGESAIFVTGPNIFNFQGYFYFKEKVLPLILKTIPEFSLWITGTCSAGEHSRPGISPKGFIENLSEVYCSARFAICPILGGTGQQIKIIEAMAHGLPVVATKYSASTSPIVHGYNGYIAENVEEFADYCIKLWQDPVLCREMGNAARKTIEENFSEDLLLTKLYQVINMK